MWNTDRLQRIIDAVVPSRRLRRRRRRSLNWNSERLETKTLLSAFFVNAVTDLPDIAPGDGVAVAADGSTTLRAAVEEANANSGRDTVVLPPGVFELWRSPVGSSDAGGPLTITDDLTILGAGLDRTIIDSLAVDRAFVLSDFTAVRLDSLTILSDAAIEPATGVGNVVEFSAAEVVTSTKEVAPDDSASDPVDQPLVSNIPNYDGPLTTSNSRQADLLRSLYGQEIASPRQPLELLSGSFAVLPAQSTDRLDITLGGNAPTSQLLTDSPVERPESDNAPQLATSDPEVPTEIQQRRDDVVNSLFVEPGVPMADLPMADLPMQESAIKRVSGSTEQRQDEHLTPRPEPVPTPEDIAPDATATGRRVDEPLNDTPLLLLPGESFEAPVVIPETLLPESSTSETTPLFEPVGDFIEPEPIRPLLPDAQETTPLLLPDNLDQSQAHPAESSTVVASLLLLIVRPAQWRKAIRAWRSKQRFEARLK